MTVVPDLSLLQICLLLPVAIIVFILIFLKLIVHPHSVKIQIKSRHVFITGGSRGIGLALARQAAAEGARVTILARNLERLKEAKNYIRLSTGVDVNIVSADVCDFEAIKEAVESAGPIDVLICNHGIYPCNVLEKLDMKVIKGIIDINLIGTFNLVKAALPGMKNRRDRKPVSIVLMSSQSGQVGIYGYSAYSASKYGLRGLAEALQQEVIAYDIYVSLVFPPDTDTISYAEEQKKRPPLTSIIAASSSIMETDKVANKALNGIKSGSFFVFCNFKGLMLWIGTAGVSPQRSYLMAFVEVVFGGVVRIVALCHLWSWYGSIEKWHAETNIIQQQPYPGATVQLTLIFLKLIVRPHSVKIPIKSRHVFISGGSSGIGLALARQVAAEGARVSILARNLKKLEEAKDYIRLSTGIDVNIVSADVCDFEAIKEAVESAGPIDVLICNQGFSAPCEFENQDIKEVESVIDVNLIGTFNLVKSALLGMKNRSDRKAASIVFMSSQAGQVGVYGYTAYSACKFGLRGLAEALQQEVIANDIHVSLIFSPETDTAGLREAKKRMPQLTSNISASSSAMQVDEVAKKALNGIKSGSFIVYCNLEGLLLWIATAGISPQRSYLMAFVEVIGVGVMRVVALCYLRLWYDIIGKWHATKKRL